MSRRRRSLILVLIIVLALALFFALTRFGGERNNGANNLPNTEPTNNKPKGPLLVVPENPAGVFGLLIAFLAGLGIFGVVKRRIN